MPKESKFTEKELKEVQDIRNEYLNIQNSLGQLTVSRIRLEDEADRLSESEISLKGNLKNLQEREQKFLDGTTEKYGQGTLNPETGVFTPNP